MRAQTVAYKLLRYYLEAAKISLRSLTLKRFEARFERRCFSFYI